MEYFIIQSGKHSLRINMNFYKIKLLYIIWKYLIFCHNLNSDEIIAIICLAGFKIKLVVIKEV